MTSPPFTWRHASRLPTYQIVELSLGSRRIGSILEVSHTNSPSTWQILSYLPQAQDISSDDDEHPTLESAKSRLEVVSRNWLIAAGMLK